MAKIDIVKIDLPKNKYDIKAPNSMDPIGITIHETDNNASARNEIAYMHRNNNEVSYHFAVDEKEIIQCLPLNRNGWHAGDGHGTGNRKTIAIEICRNLNRSDKSIPAGYYDARANAEKLTGYLLHKYGWTDKDIYTHNHWNGKNCPRRIREQGYLSTFKKNAMIWKAKFAGEKVEAPKPSKPEYKEVTAAIVNDVILGKYGNGAERKRRLEEAGYNYEEVQDAVNRSYGAKPQPKPKPKPQAKPKPKPSKQKNNKVTVKKYAKRFDTGERMDDWVKGSTFDVLQKGKGRTLIANKGVAIGWVKDSDLVGGVSKTKPKPKKKASSIKKGDTVVSNAKKDIFGTSLDSHMFDGKKKYKVIQVGRNGNKDHVLLDGVMTWVHKSKVKKV